MGGKKPNWSTVKVNLRLSCQRLKLQHAKKASMNQAARADIAHLLAIGKDESARIRVEHIIREDFYCEAMEIMELYCDMLLGRFALLEQTKSIDPSLLEAVMTIIYASPRMDIKELKLVREEFGRIYGQRILEEGMANIGEHVNTRVIHKLSILPPDSFLVEQYLRLIAKSYNVTWEPPTAWLPGTIRKTGPRPDLCLVDASLPDDVQDHLQPRLEPSSSSSTKSAEGLGDAGHGLSSVVSHQSQSPAIRPSPLQAPSSAVVCKDCGSGGRPSLQAGPAGNNVANSPPSMISPSVMQQEMPSCCTSSSFPDTLGSSASYHSNSHYYPIHPPQYLSHLYQNPAADDRQSNKNDEGEDVKWQQSTEAQPFPVPSPGSSMNSTNPSMNSMNSSMFSPSSAPSQALPPPASSSDFDDLNRRFEALKRRDFI